MLALAQHESFGAINIVPWYRPKELGKNNIGSRGCKYLSRGKWKCLTNINICTHPFKQIGTKLEIKVASIYQKPSGKE